METFAKKHGDSTYSNKTKAGEDRITTHWSKRRIVTDDDLNRLQSLIVSDNIDTNTVTQFEISNCACQGACQAGCAGDCKSGCMGGCAAKCQNDCYSNCDASCKGGCGGGCKAKCQSDCTSGAS
ncbi:MAG: hypothetical protein IJ673_08805 [Treponema sp.]|nr:hypothetical protein [Treponema sp.]